MSSSTKTTTLQLNQWSRTDGVCMDDFNADNLAIDTAFSGLRIPSVKLLDVTTSTDAEQVDLDFSTLDLSPFRSLEVVACNLESACTNVSSNNAGDRVYLRVNGDASSSYHYYSNLSYSSTLNGTYTYLASGTLPYPIYDYTNLAPSSMMSLHLAFTPGHDATRRMALAALNFDTGIYRAASEKAWVNLQEGIYTQLNSIASLQTLNFVAIANTAYNSGASGIKAGARFLVYGNKT